MITCNKKKPCLVLTGLDGWKCSRDGGRSKGLFCLVVIGLACIMNLRFFCTSNDMVMMDGQVTDKRKRGSNARIRHQRPRGDNATATTTTTTTFDIFIMLPGIEMDVTNMELFNSTLSSALELYDEEYVHIVYNAGDPTYVTKFPKLGYGMVLGLPPDLKERYHIVQNNNFALGAFASASTWMSKYRPNGNYIMLQHSSKLIAKAQLPSCDIELINLRQRCGTSCCNADNSPSKMKNHPAGLCEQNYNMLTTFGTETIKKTDTPCFPILNHFMGTLYNTTCSFPCCPFPDDSIHTTIDDDDDDDDSRKSQQHRHHHHYDYWPLMAHNTILLTPRARKFLQSLVDYVIPLSSGSIGKKDDEGTERLWGLFSTMLLERYGPIRDENGQYKSYVTPDGHSYNDPLEAYQNRIFLCSQDLTSKTHGRLQETYSMFSRSMLTRTRQVVYALITFVSFFLILLTN